MTAMKPVADQLRALIQAELNKGTSLREIARRADVAAPVVSRLMQGKTVTMETAESLAKALGKKLRIG